jgi:DNA-binding PadR family transcriptional regulator
MKDDLNKLLPLSPAVLHILLALSSEDRHGYGIMQEIARQSEGRYKLGPGTLYDNLEKLLEHDFVRGLPRRAGNDDPRRRYYRLTSTGRKLLAAEVERLQELVREAREHLRLNPGRVM